MGWFGSVFEWFTKRQGLKEARSREPTNAPWAKLCLERANACAALADIAREPSLPEDLRIPEAVGLYRTACLWLLSGKAGEAKTPEQLVETFPADDAPRWKEPLLRSVFDDARLETDRLTAEAQSLQVLFKRQRSELSAPFDEIAKLRWQRWTRCLGLAALLLILGITTQQLVRRAIVGPNLAAGKPWRTSSVLALCEPLKHHCGGATTDIFFHTQEEDGPWIEVDLGAPTKVSRVEIDNRRDCCQERAFPLVVEISADRNQWKEVSRRKELFNSWTAQFPRTTARYVRVRLLKRASLHLEGLVIRR